MAGERWWLGATPQPCTCLGGPCEGACGYDPAAWDTFEAVGGAVVSFFDGLFRLHDHERCPGSGARCMPIAGFYRCSRCAAMWGASPGPHGFEEAEVPYHRVFP